MNEPIKARALELCRAMSDTKALMQLAAEGWLLEASTLRNWRLAAGIPAYRRALIGNTPEELRRCVEVYRRHGEVTAAARELGLSPRTLVRRLQWAGAR